MATTVKPAMCPCNKAWMCEDHPDQPWGMMTVELRESSVQIHSATKILILFFYPPIVRYSPEEENRQSEKLHSALDL